MRQTLFLTLALLLTLPFGDASLRKSDCDALCRLPSRHECQSDAAPHEDAASLEDASLERRLTQQAGMLVEQSRTVEASVLIKQLEHGTCTLVLPQVPAVARNTSELFHATKESVVVVSGIYRCRKCSRWHTTPASGFVIAPQGIVVTNYHVINDPTLQSLVVMLPDRRVLPVQEILAANRAVDLAVLKVPATDLTPLPLAMDPAVAPVGSAVAVISHPNRQFYCLTTGVISRYFTSYADGEMVDEVSITADYARGSSGAPVLNSQGQVVGIVKSTESVYYVENAQQQRDLQMVFKNCIPARSIARLLSHTPPGQQTPTAHRRPLTSETTVNRGE